MSPNSLPPADYCERCDPESGRLLAPTTTIVYCACGKFDYANPERGCDCIAPQRKCCIRNWIVWSNAKEPISFPKLRWEYHDGKRWRPLDSPPPSRWWPWILLLTLITWAMTLLLRWGQP